MDAAAILNRQANRAETVVAQGLTKPRLEIAVPVILPLCCLVSASLAAHRDAIVQIW